GGNGGDGRDGQSGEPGRDAENVEVHVTMAEPLPGQRLLQVRTRGTQSGVEQLFLVDPHGGSLTINANGGHGGHGGNGGHGGRGGRSGRGGQGTARSGRDGAPGPRPELRVE